MAKTLKDISLYFTSANSEFSPNTVMIRYSVVDGDLSKVSSWTVSGVDFGESVSGFWDLALIALENIEGI